MANALKKEKEMEERKPTDGVVLRDLKLANAVKVGTMEETYLDCNKYELHMHNNLVISIKKIVPPGSTIEAVTVYTSVMNAIYWRK